MEYEKKDALKTNLMSVRGFTSIITNPHATVLYLLLS